jgi:hypothetical protein
MTSGTILKYHKCITIRFYTVPETGQIRAEIDGKVYPACKTESDALLTAITAFTNEIEKETGDNGTD